MSDENAKEKSEVAKREEATLAFWNEKKIFEKSLDPARATKGEFVFYDGPPFATGLPHYGHLLQSFVKDAIPRYKTMQGFRVERQWGWDCHGLPIENIVEKELGTKSKKDIVAMGVKKFNDLCRERIFTFIHEWERIIPRIGRWADMERAYRTMDFSYMESEWWAFKQLHEKGLVYEDYRSMHICPRCETTLSQGEVAEGYKDIKDLSATVKFKVKNPEKHGLPENTYLLAWTTTPWTLPGNVALAVGKEIEYFCLKTSNAISLIVEGKPRLPEQKEYVLVAKESPMGKSLSDIHHKELEIKGSALVGLEYEPLFDYYAKDEKLKNRENGWKVYAADFVTADSGTGIAHEAPTFGADDWSLLKKYDLPFVQHVKTDGTFKSEVTDFPDFDLKPRAKNNPAEIREADLAVVRFLEKKGLIFASEKYEHAYPHCWRCDTALLNYATSSWFVAVEKLKPTLLETAQSITWSPAHIKEGRFGQWLAGARDWSISRQRFWANTIPVWRCGARPHASSSASLRGPSASVTVPASTAPSTLSPRLASEAREGVRGGCGNIKVFGSVAELEQASGVKVSDLHKDVVDEVTFACECGGTNKRVPDVLDTWFDSGSVPFAAKGDGAKSPMQGGDFVPADFIGEAQDQTRAWFYYQHVLAGGLFGKAAFKNCVVTGLVLAEDGKKMAKKLNNYPDPMSIVDKYGADALRLYVLSSPIVQGENLNFSEKGVDEVVKKNITRLMNVLAFYQLYANDTPRAFGSAHVLDRWIIARLGQLIAETTEGYERYALDSAVHPLGLFIDDLSTWYIRRSRDRFKATDPIAPSASLRGPAVSSVVPSSTPPETASPRLAPETIGSAAQDKRDALATLRYVLHTLARVMAPATPFIAEHIFQAVREDEDEESVHLASWPESDAAQFDPNMLVLMETARRIVSMALEARDKAGIKVRQPLSKFAIAEAARLSAELLNIIADEVNVKEVVAGDEGLDTDITAELREEGLVRELVRSVQSRRKDMALVPSDVVRLFVPDIAAIHAREAELRKTLNASDIVYAKEWQGTPLALEEGNIVVGVERA